MASLGSYSASHTLRTSIKYWMNLYRIHRPHPSHLALPSLQCIRHLLKGVFSQGRAGMPTQRRALTWGKANSCLDGCGGETSWIRCSVSPYGVESKPHSSGGREVFPALQIQVSFIQLEGDRWILPNYLSLGLKSDIQGRNYNIFHKIYFALGSAKQPPTRRGFRHGARSHTYAEYDVSEKRSRALFLSDMALTSAESLLL